MVNIIYNDLLQLKKTDIIRIAHIKRKHFIFLINSLSHNNAIKKA